MITCAEVIAAVDGAYTYQPLISRPSLTASHGACLDGNALCIRERCATDLMHVRSSATQAREIMRSVQNRASDRSSSSTCTRNTAAQQAFICLRPRKEGNARPPKPSRYERAALFHQTSTPVTDARSRMACKTLNTIPIDTCHVPMTSALAHKRALTSCVRVLLHFQRVRASIVMKLKLCFCSSNNRLPLCHPLCECNLCAHGRITSTALRVSRLASAPPELEYCQRQLKTVFFSQHSCCATCITTGWQRASWTASSRTQT